jgi:alpha,alpha-trehalase
LGWDAPDIWDERATARRDRVDRYLWDEGRGIYLDYDVDHDARSPVAAATTFQPLFVGMASAEQAARVAENLSIFERAHGLAVTEVTERSRDYQWAYPNMWPPILWVAVEGLARYGFHQDAERLAETYCEAQNRLFEKTDQLWEKIDVETGEPAGGEYEAQPMIGWSAGVYVACAEYLKSRHA